MCVCECVKQHKVDLSTSTLSVRFFFTTALVRSAAGSRKASYLLAFRFFRRASRSFSRLTFLLH